MPLPGRLRLLARSAPYVRFFNVRWFNVRLKDLTVSEGVTVKDSPSGREKPDRLSSRFTGLAGATGHGMVSMVVANFVTGWALAIHTVL